MIVGIKDAAKLAGIIIITFCAVLVCTMFLNYNLDIAGIREEITGERAMIFYEAQVSTAKVASAVSGGCLLATSAIMLLFYIKHYIDTHKKELGILKALGYSNLSIARSFWVFGTSVFAGALLGFIAALLIMPLFYSVQNADKFLPDIAVHFHPALLVYLVIAPTAAFAALSVCYAWHRLKMPVMSLLRENVDGLRKAKGRSENEDSGSPFLVDLKKSTLRDKKVLVFFIIFASFCFSSMTQMSFAMKELASVMMSVMTMLIGLVLACTTLLLAITTVVNGNAKTIAVMRAFGYSQKECCGAILGGYRLPAYIGFAIGSVYQYVLLRIMVDIVFRDVEGMPAYKFDFPGSLVSLAAFIAVYELAVYACSERIKKSSVKEIMTER